jgi:aerobic carbon-monoxide dehydrogenase large subunit
MSLVKFGVGQAVARREDDGLLAGRAQFVDDVGFPGALHMVLVRSPYPHARITSIDLDAARRTPGVAAIYTGADLAAAGVGAFANSPALRGPDGKPLQTPAYTPLATDVVRYVGQPVLAVIAASRALAEHVASEILVDYDPLPAVTALDAAMATGAPAVWPTLASNVIATNRFGDAAACEAAFARAAHVSRIHIDNQRLSPVTMEPRAGAAEIDAASGRITVHASSQNPAGFAKGIATVLKLDPAVVRVKVHAVGGGFGMKAMVHPEDVLCAFAAKALQRTVRWRASRNEEFQAASHGRDQSTEAELAFAADGKILGLRVRLAGNVGAYGTGAGVAINLVIGPKVITGVYHVPALDLQAQAVITNTNIVGAYRGAGRPESIYTIERLMDQAAAELKMDPAELRRRNLIPPTAMPYKTPMGETFDSGDFPALLAKALAASDWAGYAARKAATEAKGLLRGRAVSTFLEWTGAMFEERMRVEVTGEGHVRAYTALQAMGQGIETSFVQILAETLQIDAGQIQIVQGDSDIGPGLGSMGSRSLYIGGSALLTASNLIIEQGKDLAAKALEVPAADLDYANGRFRVAGTDLGIDLAQLAAQQADARIAVDTTQKVAGPSWPNGVHVCEVEIDPATGETCIDRYSTFDDVGRVINPMIVAGQVHGGIAQALGQALMERVVYDAESGQLLTGSFMDYAVPRAGDLPRFDTTTDESQPCKINPLGAKGVGELGTVGATPTVINAIVDALRPLGVQDIAMPATPERIWRALQDARRD